MASIKSLVLCLFWTVGMVQGAILSPRVSDLSRSQFVFSEMKAAAVAPEPRLHILLTPEYDNDNFTSIQVLLRFTPDAELAASENLLFSLSGIANTPALSIKSNTLRVSDAKGDIQITARQEYDSYTVSQYWMPNRQPDGWVEVSYTALPRFVNNMTLSRPALDFRWESQGFTSSAYAMLMVPADLGTMYSVTLDWDMKNAPAGTKAVWSFGEHHRTVSRKMAPSQVLNSYFGGGHRLNAFIDECAMDQSQAGFNVYWFDEPPFAAYDMSTALFQMFRNMSVFFQDDSKTYRVFLRHNPYAGTNTGTALDRSFIMGYDDSDVANPPPVLEKLEILSHEMVHNWILWDDTVDMTKENWYPEGMAEYYSILFLYALRILSPGKFVAEVNNKLSSYYTSPYVYRSIADAANHTWEATSAQRLPYRRGFTMALVMDGLIHESSDGAYTLDGVVLELVWLKRTNQLAGPGQFIDSAARVLGSRDVAEEMYAAVTEGSILLRPRTETLRGGRFNLPVTLVRSDQEQFELGFSEQAARTGKHSIENLIQGSRAQKAGIREGDQVVNQFQVSSAEADFKKTIKSWIKTTEDDGIQEVEFWPRASRKTESWFFSWGIDSEEL